MKQERSIARRIVIFLLGSVLGWAILAIGFLSPLTPSEGYPGGLELFLFLGIPMLLIGVVSWYGRHRVIGALGVVQLLLILWIAKWLLIDVLNYPWFR